MIVKAVPVLLVLILRSKSFDPLLPVSHKMCPQVSLSKLYEIRNLVKKVIC